MVPGTLLFMYVYAQRLVVLNEQRVWTPGGGVIWRFSDAFLVVTTGGREGHNWHLMSRVHESARHLTVQRTAPHNKEFSGPI